MKYVIDIDGVICNELGTVSERLPYASRISLLNKLYDEGNTIVIFTSRGMNSTNDDPVASDLKYRDLTEKQLSDWGVKYHKLFFGKPNADVYVDNHNAIDTDFFRQLKLLNDLSE